MSAPEKNTVLVSGPVQFQSWAKDLEARLETYGISHRYQPFRAANIDEDIAHFPQDIAVAVILLCPPMLVPENRFSATKVLLSHLRKSRIRILPIILEECDWKRLKFPETPWKKGVPQLDRTSENRPAVLDEIAKKVASLINRPASRPASKPKPKQEQAPTLHLSQSADTILRMARELADQSGREVMTSSCVLFAFAEVNPAVSQSARFVRRQLEWGSEVYRANFERFRTAQHAVREVSTRYQDTFLRLVSGGVVEILEVGERFARMLSPTAAFIGARHLLAALLAGHDGNESVAERRLGSMGINGAEMRRDFRRYVSAELPDEDPTIWDEILGTLSEEDAPTTPMPALSSPAGYTSEFCGIGGTRKVRDHLSVRDYAWQLSELIALRETKLPLSVGLFGNWGAGKSHFMNLMDAHLKTLANEKEADWAKRAAAAGHALRDDPNGKGPWCQQIVPIYFNAWHYLDTNLWASLVTEIFDALFRHVAGNAISEQARKAKIEQLLAELHDVRGTVAGAEEALEIAKAAKGRAETEEKKAKDNAEKAEQQRSVQQSILDGLLNNLDTLLPQYEQDEKWKEAVETLGLNFKGLQNSYGALLARVDELRALGGRTRSVVSSIFAKDGRGIRLAWLAGAVIVTPIVGGLLVWGATYWNPEIRKVGQAMGQLTGLLAGVGAWGTAQLSRGESLLKKAEDLELAARKAREDRIQNNTEVKSAQSELEQRIKEEEIAKERLAEARARVRRIEEELHELRPERRLYRFIEQRAQAKDYRSQLGLVSLAREDFKKLNEFFLETDAVIAKETEADANLSEEERVAKKEQRKELGARIDRIVLFVDDLDRCSPTKVVDVLQAVHLLLAYPLFAVVVGVDQRCLKRSLEDERPGLVANGNGASAREPIATPLDYLEKIFHIPFHLPKMAGKDFANLIDKLTESDASKEKPDDAGKEKQPAAGVKPLAQVKGGGEQANDADAGGEEVNGENIDGEPVPPNDGETQELQPKPVRVIGSSPLFDWERTALGEYHEFISTPRGATRLLNTYRLARAGIRRDTPDETQVSWTAFQGDEKSNGEFRIAMLLLAVAAGRPSAARGWFAKLQAEPALFATARAASRKTKANGSVEDPEWNRFLEHARAVYGSGKTGEEKHALFSQWIHRVERFSF